MSLLLVRMRGRVTGRQQAEHHWLAAAFSNVQLCTDDLSGVPCNAQDAVGWSPHMQLQY